MSAPDRCGALIAADPKESNTVCLAIPGKVLSSEDLGLGRAGRVQFGEVVRPVRLDFVPEAQPGDYVLVHVGFAISKIDEAEALRTYALLAEIGALEEELPPEPAGPSSVPE